jgi:hypothetical protein
MVTSQIENINDILFLNGISKLLKATDSRLKLESANDMRGYTDLSQYVKVTIVRTTVCHVRNLRDYSSARLITSRQTLPSFEICRNRVSTLIKALVLTNIIPEQRFF